MSLFYPALQRAIDANGRIASGAKWFFYLTGTTTPTPIYSDADLNTSLGTSITANSGGLFNSGNGVYLDESIETRAVLKTAAGATLTNLDPCNLTGGPGGEFPAVASKAALAAIDGVAGEAYFVAGDSGGIFEWTSSNISSSVTIDIAEGIYVAPDSDNTGASGGWKRRYGPSDPWKAEWFGLPTGGDDKLIVKSIEALREDGRAVHFGAGTFLFSDIRVNKPGHWRGVGKATIFQNNGSGTYNTFGISTSGGTRISHARFIGLDDADNADAQFSINVSPRVNVVDTPETLEDFEFDHLFFDDCDTGIRVSFGGTGTANDVPGTTWWTPKKVHIHDCEFNDVLYQAIIPEAHDIFIERCKFKLTSKPGGGYRPFSHFLRILGCNRLTVRDNYFECPYDYQMISLQMAGVDNGLSNVAFRSANHVTIDSNRFNGGFIGISHTSGQAKITRNYMWNNPTSTSDVPPACFYALQSDYPIYFCNVEVEDNTCVGYPAMLLVENFTAHTFSFKRNKMIGNKKTGAAYDAVPIKLQVNNGEKFQDNATQIPPPVIFEIEDNWLFCNPSMVGSFIYIVGKMDGLHLSVVGNKTSERQGVGTALIAVAALVGDFQLSIARNTKFDSWAAMVAAPVDFTDDDVGDNIAMPTGHYASLMASSFFRDEQTVSTVYPAVFA